MKFYNHPKMVIAQPEGEAPILGIAYKDEIICCCCGGVYDKYDNCIILQEIDWYNIPEEMPVPELDVAIGNFYELDEG